MAKLLQWAFVCFILSCSGCAATCDFIIDTISNSLSSDDGDDLPKPLTDRMSKRDAARANAEYDNANRVAEY
jgi:hypothetical protein